MTIAGARVLQSQFARHAANRAVLWAKCNSCVYPKSEWPIAHSRFMTPSEIALIFFNGSKQWLSLESPYTKTNFAPDRKKQGCHGSGVREAPSVIPPRGKLYTDATLVLLSPYETLVLEAVLSVIGGESAQAVPTPFRRLPNFFTLGPRRRESHFYNGRTGS